MRKFIVPLLTLALMTSCSQYSLVNSDVYNDAKLSDYHTFRIVTPDDGKLPPGMQMVTYYNIAAAIREQLVERGFTEDPNSPILVNIGLTVNKGTTTSVYNTPGQFVGAPPVWGPGPGPAPAPGPGPAPGPNGPRPRAEVPVNDNLPEVAPSPEPGLVMPPEGSGLHPVAQQAPQQEPQPQPQPRLLPPPPGPVYNNMVPYFMYPRGYYLPGNTQIVTSVYREGVLTMDIVDIQTKTPLYSSSVATILDQGDTQFRNLEGIAKAVKTLFSKFPVPLLPQYK